MFGWLGKLRRRRPGLWPESTWRVALSESDIRVTDGEGRESGLAKAALCGVVIETNDSGPWGADVWWLLFGADDMLACAYPQGATGEAEALAYLVALPGFDHEAMIRAMRSVDNALFPVWRRAAD